MNDRYLALAYVVRDHLLDRWIRSAQRYYERASRTVAYLSAEYCEKIWDVLPEDVS